MRVGLVLEGGAMRGLFTAGVLDVFLDEGIQVDSIVSVSAGALFGANFPSKQRGRAIRYNKRFLNDSRYISLKSLITTGNIVNKDFAYYEMPFTLDPFDNETFKNSPIDFYATVTNVETGKAEYHLIQDGFAQMEVFRATSSMPYVSKIVEIEGKPYLDGAIADSIPIDFAKTLDVDKLIVVLTRTLDYRKKPSCALINKLYYRQYPEFVTALNNRAAEYNQRVEEIVELEKKGEIFVIRPSQDLAVKRIEKDVNKIQAIYDLGISDCRHRMTGLKQYLEK